MPVAYSMTCWHWDTPVVCIALNVSCRSRLCERALDAVDFHRTEASAVRLLTTFRTANSRLMHPTRNVLLTSPTSGRLRAGYTQLRCWTCTRVGLLAGQCTTA